MLRRYFIPFTMLSLLAGTNPGRASYDSDIPTDVVLPMEQTFTISFTGPVDVGRSAIRVFGPHGEVAVGTPVTGSNPSEVVIPLSRVPQRGTYVIHFSSVSSLGEAFSGTTTVFVQETGPAADASAIDASFDPDGE